MEKRLWMVHYQFWEILRGFATKQKQKVDIPKVRSFAARYAYKVLEKKKQTAGKATECCWFRQATSSYRLPQTAATLRRWRG